MKISVFQMNAHEGNFKFYHAKLDKFTKVCPTPRELANVFNQLHGGITDLLTQVACYMHEDRKKRY
jgi:hypothetical protein